jgi:hypothetical protein
MERAARRQASSRTCVSKSMDRNQNPTASQSIGCAALSGRASARRDARAPRVDRPSIEPISHCCSGRRPRLLRDTSSGRSRVGCPAPARRAPEMVVMVAVAWAPSACVSSDRHRLATSLRLTSARWLPSRCAARASSCRLSAAAAWASAVSSRGPPGGNLRAYPQAPAPDRCPAHKDLDFWFVQEPLYQTGRRECWPGLSEVGRARSRHLTSSWEWQTGRRYFSTGRIAKLTHEHEVARLRLPASNSDGGDMPLCGRRAWTTLRVAHTPYLHHQ